MATLMKIVLALGLLGSGVYLASQRPAGPAPPRRCRPLPASPMDPQPGLARFRCAPDLPGDGPPITAGDLQPDDSFVNHVTVAPPPRTAAAQGTLREAARARDDAYRAYLDAQRGGERDEIWVAHQIYQDADRRLRALRAR